MWGGGNQRTNSGGYFQPPADGNGPGFSFPTADPYAGAAATPPGPPPLPARPGMGNDVPGHMPSPPGGTRGFGNQDSPAGFPMPGSSGGYGPPSGALNRQGSGGYGQGNTGYGQGNAGYGQGNAGYGQGNAGYGQGNAGYGQASRGYGPPSGPPPGPAYSPPQSGYPGASYRSGPSPNSSYNGGGGGGGGYGPPSGSPPNNGWVPPSNGYAAPTANFTPPSGPPPGSNSPFPYQPPGTPHMPPSQAQYYGPTLGTPGGNQSQPSFQYSQCTGKKKALIIGINYIGTDQALAGCCNDATRMREFIIKHFNYKKEDIVMLTDESRRPEEQPTRANILRGMEWLVRFASADDSLFFHYSGHGGLTKDLDGDEEDGWDEVIYPIDYKQTDHIVDDQMHDIMVRPLPAGCRLTAVFDSCHSGSALDLPYIYSTEGKVKEPNLVAAAGSSIMDAGMSYLKKDYAGVFKGVKGLVSAASGTANKADELARRTKSSPADVISWSGCKDSQTSADTQVNGQGTGAMSWAFMASLDRNPQQSYQQLLVSVRSLLREKYSQRPQLSSSHPMDTNILFIA